MSTTSASQWKCRRRFEEGKEIKASYQFEVAVSVRGYQWQLTRREVRENSAIFRTVQSAVSRKAGGVRPPDRSQSPHLFSAFLDRGRASRRRGRSACRSTSRCSCLTTKWTACFLKRHYEGGYIYEASSSSKPFRMTQRWADGGSKRLSGQQSGQARQKRDTKALPDERGLPSRFRSSNRRGRDSRARSASKRAPGPESPASVQSPERRYFRRASFTVGNAGPGYGPLVATMLAQ